MVRGTIVILENIIFAGWLCLDGGVELCVVGSCVRVN